MQQRRESAVVEQKTHNQLSNELTLEGVNMAQNVTLSSTRLFEKTTYVHGQSTSQQLVEQFRNVTHV